MLRNKILYFLIAGYSVVFSILYNEYISVLIMTIILFLPLVLLLILFLTVPFVKVTLMPSHNTVAKGDSIAVSFHVKNNSILPISFFQLYLTYSFGQGLYQRKETISLAIDGKSEQIVHCNLEANHCGLLTYSCKMVKVYDYFRIFSYRKKYKDLMKVMILPQIYEMEEEFVPNPFGLVMDSDVYSKSHPGDDPSEVFGIREYQEGDRLHRIHWKLSSKKNQYMIKEFSLPMNCSVDLMVDLYCGDRNMKSLDAIYETTASLSNHFIVTGVLHSITWYDKEKNQCIRMQIDDWEQIHDCFTELFGAAVYQEKDKGLKVYGDTYHRDGMADIFYIGNHAPEDVKLYMKPSKECRLHVLYLGGQQVLEEKLDTKVSFIEAENVEASLKRVVF